MLVELWTNLRRERREKEKTETGRRGENKGYI